MNAHETTRAASGDANSTPAGADTATTVYVDATSGTTVTVPDAAFLANAQYVRHGADLYAADSAGRTIVVRGYFNADPAPDLVTTDGERSASPELIEPFVVSSTPGQYAQLGAPASGPQIGQVSEMSGGVFAVRADGTRVELGTGDPLYQGDVVETGGDDSAVRILLIDQTTFAIGPDARLALDEMTFNPQDHSGEVSFTMLKGVFIFTSGLVAKKDPSHMTVNTPVALIGIRGTVVTGNLDDLGGQFTVLYGAISVETNAGSVTMSEAGATTQVTNINAPPAGVFVLGPNEYAAIYKAVSGVAPGSYLMRDAPDDTDGTPDDLGATLPGDPGARGSVGQSVASLIGSTLLSLAALDAAAQVPDLTTQIQDVLDDLVEDDTATEAEGEEVENQTATTDVETPSVFDFSGAAGPVNFTGNDSAEIVLGSAFADSIDTRGGNDTVVGNNGNDVILAGTGNDVVDANNGAPAITFEHDFVTTAAIPALVEGEAIDPSQINGVDSADLTLQADNPVSVVFQSEGAGNQNSLGYYVIGPNGEIGDVQFIWTNASGAGSGGNLQAGDSVALDVGAGDTFAFFLIADGATENDFAALQDGSFEFRDAQGNPATVDTVDPILYFIGADGTETVIDGDIFHTGSPSQNADGAEHAVSGLSEDGESLVIGFEDLSGGGDQDYEDLVIEVEIAPVQSPGTDSDTVDGGPGNDTLIGGAGDTLLGGDGNDLFRVPDLTFAQIDGGAGTDTVQFTGDGASFNLTQVGAEQLAGIEKIDLTGADGATLTLDAETVLTLTDGGNALLNGAENTLVIAADADDQVNLGEGWSENGSAEIEGESYSIYSHEDFGAQVAVSDQNAVA
ncbi:MAG: DUF4114 domain-containing protein [Gammaproteobacteria bacterium]